MSKVSKMKSMRNIRSILQCRKPEAVTGRGLSRGVVTESRVVKSDLLDIDIPDLTFPQMCWSREERFRDQLALVKRSKRDTNK